MSQILVPVSPGEVIDKITILRIKAARMSDPAKLAHVRAELELLEATWRDCAYGTYDVRADEAALHCVNEKLWDIEDSLRRKEHGRQFDAEFVELARSVYINNDQRSAIKKRINTRLGSALVEEKSYSVS